MTEPNMAVSIAGVTLKNPVMTASGTFGSGMEYSEFFDLSKLGAVVTKGVADVPWAGNPTPRVCETASGMLNAIGLQNPGIDVFCERDLPFLRKYDTNIIVNVCGHSSRDQHLLSECKAGRHRFRNGPEGSRGNHKGSQSPREAADHYEAVTECHGY